MMPRIFTLLIVSTLLSGCGSPPIPDDHFYRFPDAPKFSAGEQLFEGQFHVEMPRAVGVRRETSLLYSADPRHVHIERYNYHHWEDAPARLIHRRLISAMRSSGMAEKVSERPGGDAKWRLASELRRFERLIDNDGVSVVVGMDVHLRQMGSGDDGMRVQYQELLPAADDSMEETVVAFSDAVDRIVAQILDDLKKHGS